MVCNKKLPLFARWRVLTRNEINSNAGQGSFKGLVGGYGRVKVEEKAGIPKYYLLNKRVIFNNCKNN
jgi:hypothetical protein